MCPVCILRGKKDLKLAVRLDDGRGHCWVCDLHGSIASIIARTRRHLFNDAKRLWPYSRVKQSHNISAGETTDVVLALPDGFTLLAQMQESRDRYVKAVMRYVTVQRGLSFADMWRRRIGVSTDPNFVNRVIIPSFDSTGKLNYYTSRSIYDDVFPRYKNAAVSKTSIVFNEIDIDWSSELLIAEGPFDTFTSDCNETCMLGNELNESHALFDRIVEHRTPVLLGLDAGMRRRADKIALLLHEFDVPVRILDVTGYKDIGVMPRTIYEERRLTARQWTPDTKLRGAIASLGNRTSR